MDPSPRSATHTASSRNLKLDSNDTTISTTMIEDEMKLATASPSQLDLSAGDRPVPDFQPGKVKAKQFPPRYYDINSLEIGTWKVSAFIHSHETFSVKSLFRTSQSVL